MVNLIIIYTLFEVIADIDYFPLAMMFLEILQMAKYVAQQQW